MGLLFDLSVHKHWMIAPRKWGPILHSNEQKRDLEPISQLFSLVGLFSRPSHGDMPFCESPEQRLVCCHGCLYSEPENDLCHSRPKPPSEPTSPRASRLSCARRSLLPRPVSFPNVDIAQ